MPGLELTANQRELLSETLGEGQKAEMLAGVDANLIHCIGEEVLVDALRLQPRMSDVREAPASFANSCNRLVNIASDPEVAFRIVGEAVIIARKYTKQERAFTEEQ